MSFFETQSQAWDSAVWEFSLVFEELEDADLWRRADPKLLSVGELASHMCWPAKYANKMRPEAPIESPLINEPSRYYLVNVDEPVALSMGVEELTREFERVMKVAKEVFLGDSSKREDPLPFDGPGRTFGEFADYMVFHIAYHTGQAFSVRHLMGHKTNDN